MGLGGSETGINPEEVSETNFGSDIMVQSPDRSAVRWLVKLGAPKTSRGPCTAIPVRRHLPLPPPMRQSKDTILNDWSECRQSVANSILDRQLSLGFSTPSMMTA